MRSFSLREVLPPWLAVLLALLFGIVVGHAWPNSCPPPTVIATPYESAPR